MKQFEFVPEIQSELGRLTKMELRKYVLEYYKNNLKGKEDNFGKRKPDESKEIIGYLNFKGRCKLDGRIQNVRIAVQFQRSAKFYYNIEVNMIK